MIDSLQMKFFRRALEKRANHQRNQELIKEAQYRAFAQKVAMGAGTAAGMLGVGALGGLGALGLASVGMNAQRDRRYGKAKRLQALGAEMQRDLMFQRYGGGM